MIGKRKLLQSVETEKVGTRSNLSGKPTYQELAAADRESRHDGFKFTHCVRKE